MSPADGRDLFGPPCSSEDTCDRSLRDDSRGIDAIRGWLILPHRLRNRGTMSRIGVSS